MRTRHMDKYDRAEWFVRKNNKNKTKKEEQDRNICPNFMQSCINTKDFFLFGGVCVFGGSSVEDTVGVGTHAHAHTHTKERFLWAFENCSQSACARCKFIYTSDS